MVEKVAARGVADGRVRRARGTPKLPREQRMGQLLDAAAQEFGQAGYGGASLAVMADRAGVSKALILSYFGSKDELYAACVERAGLNLIQRIEDVITVGRPPRAMAQATLAAIFDGLADRPHDWNVLNDRTVPPGSTGAAVAKQQRRTIAEQSRRGIRALEDLRALGDPDELAILTEIWMSSVSAVVNWWLQHPDCTAEDMTAHCERILEAIVGAGRGR